MDRLLSRRQVLECAAAAALPAWSYRLRAQQAGAGIRLTDKLALVEGGGANVLAFSAGDGFVLVDSGAPKSGDKVMSALGANAKVHTLFNTHYHTDQTGNNEIFGGAGTKIIAHEHTRQWMSIDYWVPDEDRYEKARPQAARPIETFHATGTFKAGTEQIDCGHLPLAHTDGDIYVFFRTSNVLAVGDIASPVRDPALDYFTGAWIGGRLDAMDTILRLSNEQTRIVPAFGPVMTRAEFRAERDTMEEVRSRLWKRVLLGDGPKDMLEGGILKNLPRAWKDPYRFLSDATKGMMAHHNKLDPSVV